MYDAPFVSSSLSFILILETVCHYTILLKEVTGAYPVKYMLFLLTLFVFVVWEVEPRTSHELNK